MSSKGRAKKKLIFLEWEIYGEKKTRSVFIKPNGLNEEKVVSIIYSIRK